MNHLRTILAALLLAAAPAAAQTIKTLGYNTTNGQVVYSGTNPLTFTNSRINILETGEDPVSLRNQSGSFAIYRDSTSIAVFSDGIISFAFPLEFNNTTNAATTRTNLGGTATGNAVFTATNAAAAATAIGLGTTNNVTYNTVTLLGNGDEVQLTGSHIDSISYGTLLSFEERRFAQSGTNIFDWGGTSNSLTVTPAATFSTNVTVNGTLTVKSLTTTDPVGWALDAVQTAAATNGVLTLPDAANVLRITNANAISSVTNGRLGAFYYLVNQTTNNLTISNVGGITVQGGTPLTLGANQAATLVATGPTNASVAARGDLNDVSLGGTANTAPNQTASSGSSLMTRDLGDAHYLGEMWHAWRMSAYNTTNPSVAIYGLSPVVQYTNAQAQGPYMEAFVDVTKYAGKTVKLLAYCFIDGTNGGNVQGLGRILYKTNFSSGSYSGLPLGSARSQGQFGEYTNVNTDVFDVGTNTNAMLVFTSKAGTIPTNAVMAVASFGFNRASTNTTYTNNLYMQAVQLVVETP